MTTSIRESVDRWTRNTEDVEFVDRCFTGMYREPREVAEVVISQMVSHDDGDGCATPTSIPKDDSNCLFVLLSFNFN